MNTLKTSMKKAEMDAELDAYFKGAEVTKSVPVIVKKFTREDDSRIIYSGGGGTGASTGYFNSSNDYNRLPPSYNSQPLFPTPYQSSTYIPRPHSHTHHDHNFFSQVKFGNHSSTKIADIIVEKFRDRDHIVCIDWMKNKKCELKDCPFLHDIHYTFKSLICLDWNRNNNCKFESIKCRFAHGIQDPFYKNNRAVEPRHQLLSRINRASEFTSYTRGRSRSRSRGREIDRRF